MDNLRGIVEMKRMHKMRHERIQAIKSMVKSVDDGTTGYVQVVWSCNDRE